MTPVGELLRTDAPQSLAGWAKLIGRPYFWASWGNLEHSVRTGETGGSFFDEVPAGCDAYVLKSVLHDWEDAEAMAILRVCRAAAPAATSLLLVERVVRGPNVDVDTKFSDLNMLVIPGGRERTLDDWRALLASGGFRLVAETQTASPLSVLEAIPV